MGSDPTVLTPDARLFWFYTLLGSGVLGYAGVLFVAYWIRRHALVVWLAWLFTWCAIDILIRAIMRSPQSILPQDWLLLVARLAVTQIALLGWLVVDAYLAAYNGHLNIIRRVWYWWRGHMRKGNGHAE